MMICPFSPSEKPLNKYYGIFVFGIHLQTNSATLFIGCFKNVLYSIKYLSVLNFTIFSNRLQNRKWQQNVKHELDSQRLMTT